MLISMIFIWFIMYSVIGWIYESIFCSIKFGKWDNRGMLIGPYCPIYGFGAVLDVLICSHFDNWYTVFVVCMVGSAILEFSTSYVTEKVFHAVWWDYSNKSLNLQGRICLPYSIAFGCAGLIVLYILHPYVIDLTDNFPLWLTETLSLFLSALISVDCAFTVDTLVSFNEKMNEIKATVDVQIAEKYNEFLETKDKLIPFKGKRISLPEFREIKLMESLKENVHSVNWLKFQGLRGIVSLRKPEFHIHIVDKEINQGLFRTRLKTRKKKEKEEH